MTDLSKFGPILADKLGFPDSSISKGSGCNAGDPGSIPGLGRSAGEGIGYPLQYSWASLVSQLVKNPCKEGDLGLIPVLGRSSGGGKGCPLQYVRLENSMNCVVHGVTKSQTQLSDFHFHNLIQINIIFTSIPYKTFATLALFLPLFFIIEIISLYTRSPSTRFYSLCS